MFTTKFEVIEIYKSGVSITNYLKGNKKAVKKDVEEYKKKAKNYQMVGKKAMIVWVD